MSISSFFSMTRRRNSDATSRLAFLLLATATAMFARSAGAPPGVSGAPPGGNCTSCHVGTANTGGGSVRVEFPSGSTYTPGNTYKIHIVLTDGTARRWGFEVTARRGGDNLTLAGMFAVDNAATTQALGGGEYMTHTDQGTAQGTAGSNSWDVNWTAPAAGTGTVTFFVAGNAANNNGNFQGDQIYTSSLVIQEAGPDVTGTKYALSQFVVGGGEWYTYLYFTNTNDAPATFGVKFFAADGTALTVPFVGKPPASSQVITLPPKATVFLESEQINDLRQGWAEATLPTGVTGYGVFRRTIPGRVPQEGVVPLSAINKASANMIWDENGFVTAIAILNPSDVAVTATMTIYGPDGAQIGTTTMDLPPANRAAFLMRDVLGFGGITGQRGSARISVSAGAVAALGFRNHATEFSFTSIPVDYP